MRRLATFVAAVSLLVIGQVGHAADLQAGWYAQVGNIGLYYEGSFLPTGTTFPLAAGMYGPFTVTVPGTAASCSTLCTRFPYTKSRDIIPEQLHI